MTMTTSKDSSTSGLVYPSDLLSSDNSYGGNYVIFYINIHEDSKFVKNAQGQSVVSDIDPKNANMRGYAAGQNISGTTSTVLAGGAGLAAGPVVAKLAKSVMGKSLTTAPAAVIGAGLGTLAQKVTGATSKKYKRFNKAIALHMPSDLNIKYGVNWGEEDMAGIGAIAGLISDGGVDAVSKFMKSVTNKDTGDNSSGVTGMASFLGGMALKNPVGDYLGKIGGVAANPKREQMFKSVDFRTFSMQYRFWAKSLAEADNIFEIIKLFKVHMHPEYKKDSQQFLYLYPSEFDIVYMTAGKQNSKLHKHTSCVLTDLSLNLTPQGVYTALQNGAPAQIVANLTFRELALLDKDSVNKGY